MGMNEREWEEMGMKSYFPLISSRHELWTGADPGICGGGMTWTRKK
jgi:hypothetical protein